MKKECMICVVPRSFNSLTGRIKFVDNSSVLNFPGMRAEEWQCPLRAMVDPVERR